MEAAIELAGYFAAHAVWCVSDGETLTPFIAFETFDGKRQMHRFQSDRIEDGAARANEWLEKNPDQAIRAVLVYDGFLTLQNSKSDALIVIAREYAQGDAEMTMAIPYRPACDPKGFAVERPQFIDFMETDPDWEKIAHALWVGIENHEKGAEVWNEFLEESK